MPKVPSIEAEIRLQPMAEGGRGTVLGAGSTVSLVAADSAERLSVCVLDTFSSRKTHDVAAGDSAYCIFLLTDYPTMAYAALRRGVRFDIYEGESAIGSGVVTDRVNMS